MTVSRLVIVAIVSFLALLVTLVICGSLLRSTLKEFETFSNKMFPLCNVSRTNNNFSTGDIIFMEFNFPPWSLADITNRLVQGYQEVSFLHTGVIFIDKDNILGRGTGEEYIYEFRILSDNTISPLYDRLKKFTPGRAMVRRVNSIVKNHSDIETIIKNSKLITGRGKQSEIKSGVKGITQVINKTNYIVKILSRYVAGTESKPVPDEIYNCVDSTIMFLLKAGIFMNSSEGTLPILHPVDFLYSRYVKGLPYLSKAEKIVLV